jgi:hypothetical protein
MPTLESRREHIFHNIIQNKVLKGKASVYLLQLVKTLQTYPNSFPTHRPPTAWAG